MAEFKKGDRVRVSFEGEVVNLASNGDPMVKPVDSVGNQFWYYAPLAAVSRVNPAREYKPGDKVCFKDGTVGEVCASRNITNGFVSVKYERPQATVHTYITVPTSEIEPYTEPPVEPKAVGAMPPYWIDVEEDADDKFVGRVYDLDGNCLYRSDVRHSRYGAIKWCLSWISRNTGAKS